MVYSGLGRTPLGAGRWGSVEWKSCFTNSPGRFKWRKKSVVLGVLLLVLVWAAEAETPKAGAFEVRLYPAGIITTVRGEVAVGKGVVAAWAGYNRTERRDWGEHDDEGGGGVGIGAGGQGYLNSQRRGWYGGGAAETWWLDIDWRQSGRRGTSRVIVLQPTVQLGYTWRKAKLSLDAGVSLGAEINLRTRGESVGQGAILLAGVRARRTF